MSGAAAVECVEAACAEVRGAGRLGQVLRAVLATGNMLNAGTHRGQAAGIKLESLTKLADVKARARAPPPPDPTLLYPVTSWRRIGSLRCAGSGVVPVRGPARLLLAPARPRARRAGRRAGAPAALRRAAGRSSICAGCSGRPARRALPDRRAARHPLDVRARGYGALQQGRAPRRRGRARASGR